jgi:tight adherence protein C
MIRALVTAVLIGVTVGSATRLVVRPTRRLGPRLDPYVQRSRLLLGKTADPSLLFARSPAGRAGVFGPILTQLGDRLSDLLDAGGDEMIAQRLRHAGERDLTPDQYRARQLATTVRWCIGFVILGLVSAPSGPTVLIMGGLGVAAGVSRWRSRFDRAIRRRREQMRAELSTIAQRLAIDIQTGDPVPVAVRDLVDGAEGAVVDELDDVLDWISDGSSTRAAFERAAMLTPEPAAARLYRLLATSDIGSSDTLVVALVRTGDDLRAQRREAVERLAVRRRFEMLVPTVLVMAPVMLLLLAAPIPTLIFGGQ